MVCLRMFLPVGIAVAAALAALPATVHAESSVTEQARKFLADHEKRVRPVEVAGNLAWWVAMTTGTDDAFKKKEYDRGLTEGVQFVEKTLDDNLAHKPGPHAK